MCRFQIPGSHASLRCIQLLLKRVSKRSARARRRAPQALHPASFATLTAPLKAAPFLKYAVISLVCLMSTLAFAQIRVPARRANEFVDSMGINVHMEATSTPYGNYDVINARLRALGMRHFRDEINDTDPNFVFEINRIGKLGYMLCGLIEGGNDYPPLGTRLSARAVVPMIHNLQPTIDAVEGPNEPDNSSFVYAGTAYPQGAINESTDLWSIVKGNPGISALPVLAMSEGNPQDFAQLAALTPPPIDYATYGNMHAYQGGWIGDNGLSDTYIPSARLLTGSAPLWTTEMGYHNNTNYLTNGEQQGVSPRASGIYVPIAFLSGFNRGVLRTFSYELIDEFYDPQLTSGSGEGHYGLLNYDGTPKPAYTALKNLITLLRDHDNKSFTTGSLSISFAGAPSTMRYTLLQKSNGDYYLALWNDIAIYRLATASEPGKDLYPANVPITVQFSEARPVAVYAPNDATRVNPTDRYTISTTSSSITLNLPPKVVLIRIVRDK